MTTARIRATIAREIDRRQADLRSHMDKMAALQKELDAQQKTRARLEQLVSESRLALSDVAAIEDEAKAAQDASVG